MNKDICTMEYTVQECEVKKEVDKDEEQPEGMFAAVWVKIEPEDDSSREADEGIQDNDQDVEEHFPLRNDEKKQSEKQSRNAILKCSWCDYSTRFKNSLMLHVLRHSATKSFASDHRPEVHGGNYDESSEQTMDVNHEKEGHPSMGYNIDKRSERRSKNVLRCTLCDYSTTYKNSLMLHMLRHSATKPFACDMCDYTTKYPGALQRHKNIKHPSGDEDQSESEVIDPNAAFKCDQCEFATALKWNLKSHKRKHMSEKRYKCTECSYGTAYRHNLIKHQRQHSNALFKCDKCAFTTKFEGHIYRHMSKIHNELMFEGHKCTYCDFCTIVKWRLNIHIQRSKQAEPIKCVFCGFETMYSCESKRHKRDHFNETNNEETDGDAQLESGQNFTEAADEMNIHEPIVSVEAEPPTESVDLSYGDNNEKPKHYTIDYTWVEWKNIQVLETNEGSRAFRCHLCPYASKFKATVQRHFQRRHTDARIRPYKCTNCDFATKTKDQITLHNKRSLAHQTMHCPQCPFTTQFKCQLVMHQKIHNVFKCKNCEYSSKNKYDLDTHISTQHLGKYFKCKFCDYKAARRDSLMSHEATHTGNKPLKCPHCEYRTVRNCFLMNHLTKKHTDVLKRSCEKRNLQPPIPRPIVPEPQSSEHKVVSFEDISTIIDNIKNNLCRAKSNVKKLRQN